MIAFNAADLFVTLNPATIALAILTGLIFGVVMGRSIPGYATTTYLFWLLAAGFVFFVPLAVLRGSQGADTWVRLFGTGILWGVFVLAKFVGATLTERRRQ